jgi:hypothetical protein
MSFDPRSGIDSAWEWYGGEGERQTGDPAGIAPAAVELGKEALPTLSR